MFLSVVFLGLLLSQPTPRAQAPPTPLLEPVKLGDLAAVREALSRRAPIDAADRRGLTPLMWAAASGHVEIVQLLISSGAAVDRRANNGSTALMFASANGHVDVVRALILRGADVTAGTVGGTPRQLAVERGHADIVMLIDQAEALGRRLLQAATEGHDAVVRQVLTKGAPVNMQDERGATALMIAAGNGDLGILQALLARGADGSRRDARGRTVFEWADPSSSTAKFVVAFLRERGVSKEMPRPSIAPPAPQVKASLTTLATVLGRVPPAATSVRTAQRRASTALSRLQALAAKWPAESPDDYRDNLAGYIAALEAALKIGDVETLASTVEAVAEDLEVKLEHCTLSGGRLGDSVVVRVRTVQGSTESRSWQVFYMPRVFEAANTTTPDLFPQLSSPTQETLVPGRYVMWARDPVTSRLGERTVVKVGGGRKDLLLDLPVPAPAGR